MMTVMKAERLHEDACEKVLEALIIAQTILENNVYCHKSNQNMTKSCMDQTIKQQDIDVMIMAMLKQKQGKPHPHDLPLLLQHLKSSQLLHVVLSSPIIQHLFGAVN